jgi:hypothetical protein
MPLFISVDEDGFDGIRVAVEEAGKGLVVGRVWISVKMSGRLRPLRNSISRP